LIEKIEMSESDRHINFKLMRDHILALQDAEQPRGSKKYWRSLEELADTPQFREFVAREFPQQAEGWNDPVERRTFLKLMGASLALAGLTGCVFQPTRLPRRFWDSPRRLSSAATKDGPQKLRAIQIIRTTVRLISPLKIHTAIHAVRAPRTSFRRRQFSVFTIPIARKR
jgi:MoCo/4Fe-4S cofactor protein with predicted Tat translocation signal